MSSIIYSIHHNGFVIRYYKNDISASSILIHGQCHRQSVLEFIQRSTTTFHWKNVMDVGAGFGYYTMFLSKFVGIHGNVFAFEPQPQNYKLLLRNIHENNLVNVIPYQQACSDSQSFVFIPTIKLENHNSVDMGNIQVNKEIPNAQVYRNVECITLDSVPFPSLDFIMIDVQGWEEKVLKGASSIILKDHPMLMIDFQESISSSSSLGKYLVNIGYDIFTLSHPGDHNYHLESPLYMVCIHTTKLHLFLDVFKNFLVEKDGGMPPSLSKKFVLSYEKSS